MKIGIRADGGNEFGMGHIMRTLVLAKEFKKNNNDVFYICKQNSLFPEKYKSGINKVKDEGFNVVIISEDKMLAELLKIQADCLITDSYDINEEYFNITKKYFKITGYIDDMNLHYFNVDFIINQNVGSETLMYNVNGHARLFLGTKYTMLREEFIGVSSKIINDNVKDIMITVGGADPNKLTNIIFDYIKDLEFKFHIVIGPSFEDEYIDKLIKLSTLKENVKLYFNANMIELMKKCGMCISACGSTLYELVACGVPTIGIIIADNQKEIATQLTDKGIIENLGWYNQLDKKSLCNTILELDKNFNKRVGMSKKGVSLIDGKGAERIANILNNIFA